MKKIIGIFLLLFLCLFLSKLHSAAGYGYQQKDDPLIKVFKAVVLYGRQGDWKNVGKEINLIRDRFEDIRKLFGTDFYPRIDGAIQQKDFQNLANNLANFVFFAIREKFYYNLSEKLEIFIRSKVRLRLAKEYYVTLLAGNVRNYDARHQTSLHDSIYDKFDEAKKSLGSIGFFGAGAIKPDVKRFKKLTLEIEALLLQAYPYFKTE